MEAWSFIHIPFIHSQFLSFIHFSLPPLSVQILGQQITTTMRPLAPCAMLTVLRTSRIKLASTKIPRTLFCGSSRRRLKTSKRSWKRVCYTGSLKCVNSSHAEVNDLNMCKICSSVWVCFCWVPLSKCCYCLFWFVHMFKRLLCGYAHSTWKCRS